MTPPTIDTFSTKCLLCQDNLTDKKEKYLYIKNECGHLFHRICFEDRIKRELSCPTCHFKLTPINESTIKENHSFFTTCAEKIIDFGFGFVETLLDHTMLGMFLSITQESRN